MKKILILLVLIPILFSCKAQVKPNTFPVADPDAIDYAIYTQEDGVSKKLPKAALRKHFAPKVVNTPITNVPTATGNTQNLNRFVIDPNQDAWFIDQSGNAKKFANQIQTMSIANGVLTLSKGGGSVTIPLTNFTAGAGIAIINGTISNTGDLSNTNELQNLSMSNGTLSLSQGGGSVNLSGLGQNMANTDLVANGSHTHNGAGFGLYFENYANFGYTHPTGGVFFNAQSFYINSAGSNFLQSGVTGTDITTQGRNRIYATDGNTITADEDNNNISSIQGSNNISAATGNSIVTEGGENLMQSTNGARNIIRNVDGGDIVLENLGVGAIKITPYGNYDYNDKWLHSIDNYGTCRWDNLPPAPAGGLQAVSVNAPITGNGTPASPLNIVLPTFTDTNFGNTNLGFTGDRVHQLNSKNLTMANGNGVSFSSFSNTFYATSLNKFSGPNNSLEATGGGQNSLFATGGGKNYIIASGTGGKNFMQTDLSASKPIGSVMQRKDATNSIEYTDYSLPLTATAVDNGKVLTYNDSQKKMELIAPGSPVAKPFIKVTGGGGIQGIGSGVNEHIVNTVVQWDDLNNIWLASAGEYTFPTIGRYRVTINFNLVEVIASTNGIESIFNFGCDNVGVSNVNIAAFGCGLIRIPPGTKVHNFHYDNVVDITTPGNVYFYLQKYTFQGNGTYGHDKGCSSWIIIEKI